MKECTADELLDAREKRAGLIDKLLKRYNTPLLVMRVNYPGLKKTNDVTVNIIKDISPLICTILSDKVRGKLLTQGAEGPIFYAAVDEDVSVLKAIAIDFEENQSLGRCLDLDVYDSLGYSISRQELGFPRRKCYLCEDYAHHCVRARRHSEHEIIAYIEEKYWEYRERACMVENNSVNDHCINIASLAVQAMLYEASCTPSPGLVSQTSSGAHTDMDYFTFLDSATSLINPLIHCVEAGFSSSTPKEIFQQLRLLGKLGEQQMLNKTSGVNTHKGMFFLLGVCCAAGGKALFGGTRFTSLQSIIKELTSGLVERELSSKLIELRKADDNALTNGERLFLHHKVEGIRGEIQSGLPTVFDFSLGFYKANQGLSQNHRLVQTLLAIMQFCEDTNILHRHSLETLKEVQETAKQILSIGGVATVQGLKAIEEMNEDFSNRKISPGGSADLLGVTVFLHFLEEYMGG